jgi:hypothetical protein
MTLPASKSTNWNDLLKAHVLAGHNADGTHKLAEITEYKILTLTRDMTAASGDVAYTGTGFTPRQVMFFAAVDATKTASWGSDDGTSQMCTNQLYNGNMSNNTSASIDLENNAGESQTAIIKTLDSNGFTLTWTKTATPPAGTATIIAICFK